MAQTTTQSKLRQDQSESGKNVEKLKDDFMSTAEESIQKSAEKFNEFYDLASQQLKKAENSLRAGVEKNPLLVLGGALVAGYLAGYLVKRVSVPSKANSQMLSH